jgi:hypothetical protein
LLLYQHMEELMQQQRFVSTVFAPHRGWLKENVVAASGSEHPARLSDGLPK